MKIFHYERGHVAKRALTVGELQALLAEYPPDMPVLAEWEGQYMPLGFHKSVHPYSAGTESERCDCLLLNAEYD